MKVEVHLKSGVQFIFDEANHTTNKDHMYSVFNHNNTVYRWPLDVIRYVEEHFEGHTDER